MQDKRFYPYLLLHAGIVILWVILDRTHKGIANDGAINLLSIAVLLCYFNLLYLHVMTSRRKATISECGWNLLSVSFIAALMYDGFSTLYTGAFLAFALIIGIMLVRTDASRGKMVRLLFGIAAIILSFFNFQILPAITMLVGMFMWNFIQGNIYGFNVSGMAQSQSIFIFKISNCEIFSGGTFGLEGSLLTTIVLLSAINMVILYNTALQLQ